MNILKAFIVILLLTQFLALFERTFFVSPNQFSRFWSYPAKLAAESAINNSNKFDYIFLSDKIDNMEFAYPVYAQIDPKLVLEQNKNQTQLGEYKFRKYNNIYIGSLPNTKIKDFMNNLDGSAIFIGNIEESNGIDGYEVFTGKDGEKAIIVIKK